MFSTKREFLSLISAEIVKNIKNSEKNVISCLLFLRFINKLEENIKQINTKFEILANKC